MIGVRSRSQSNHSCFWLYLERFFVSVSENGLFAWLSYDFSIYVSFYWIHLKSVRWKLFISFAEFSQLEFGSLENFELFIEYICLKENSKHIPVQKENVMESFLRYLWEELFKHTNAARFH